METPSQPSRFQRYSHLAYHRGAVVKHILAPVIRPAGLLVLIFAPLPWILLPLHNQTSIWQLRMVLLGVPFVAATWVIFRRGQVTVSRDTPRLATAGETISYNVSVHNKGRKTIRGANLIELEPDNRPSLHLFCNSKEPNEDSRNLFDRKLCYYRWMWLQKILTTHEVIASDPLPTIKPHQKANIKVSLKPLKRGVIELTHIKLCLHDPLGMFQICRKMPSSQNKIIVLPRRYHVPNLHTSGSAHFQTGGDTASNAIGQSGDFTSTRDYKPGDMIKHIHWKSWARTGKAIVKEYEDILFPRYGLVLDTHVAAEQSELFEAAVSVAASFTTSINTQQSMIDLMFMNDEAYTFSIGRGAEKSDKILEVLASVNFSTEKNFEKLQKLITQHQNDLSACILIFTGWCSQRRDTVSRLHHAHLDLVVIVISSDLIESKKSYRAHPSPLPINWVRQSHLQSDLQHMTMT